MLKIPYDQEEDYYESLKPPEFSVPVFAKDLMHYLLAEDLAIGKKVLDAGCGRGYGSYHLSVKGANKVIGVDASDERLATAKKYFSSPNLDFLVMDATAMEFPDSAFDLVVSFEVLEHLPASSTQRFMEEIARVLKADGKFAISTPNRDVYSLGSKISETPGHINELSATEFVQLMKQYFEKCDFYYQFKYEKHQLDLMKERKSAVDNGVRFFCWKDLIPTPVKEMIKSIIRSKDLTLIEHMKLWEIKCAEIPGDLDLSVIQMAICEGPVAKR
jgi:ubiquinone/menaquinone biosynthesis C-methylase UbiE